MFGITLGLFMWIISMVVFYLIIKAAVRNGVIEAHEVINQSKQIKE